MEQKDGCFKLLDYDCIGFDLDHTLARYKVGNLIELEYKIISEFLVSKGYSRDELLQPIDYNFFLKGLTLDDENGNVLQIDLKGTILQATHGTRPLKEQEILEYYPNRQWHWADAYCENPLNFPRRNTSAVIRNLTDYFEVPYSLVFARVVDSLDKENGKAIKNYGIFPDLSEALSSLYDYTNFQRKNGPFYPELIDNPDNFYYKCSEEIKNWLKLLKQRGKLLFLITSSHYDFASHTASYVLGNNWKDFFDIIICSAGKPNFFNKKRSFTEVENFKNIKMTETSVLECNKMYIHGNWNDLHSFFNEKLGKTNSKVIYFGDNLIQDIYTPNIYKCCDTVAICEELEAEGIDEHPQWHPDEQFLLSTIWGSYFKTYKGTNTISFQIISTYAKLCIPSVEYIANLQIDHIFKNKSIEP